MKSIKFLLVAIAGLAIGVAAEARTFEEIKTDGKIIVATDGTYAPFNYFQGSKLTGFEVELAEAMVKKMGLAIEWKSLAFDALLTGLRQDRWDMVIASFGITAERAKAVTFTNPHYCSGGVIVSKNGAIRNAADLVGKTVAVGTGTSYMDNARKIAGIKEVKNFPLDSDAISTLLHGRVDAWVSDRFFVQNWLEKNSSTDMKIGGYLFVEKIAVAVKKGNSSLAQAIDKALVEVMDDGTYKKLSEKYMKEDIRCQ